MFVFLICCFPMTRYWNPYPISMLPLSREHSNCWILLINVFNLLNSFFNLVGHALYILTVQIYLFYVVEQWGNFCRLGFNLNRTKTSFLSFWQLSLQFLPIFCSVISVMDFFCSLFWVVMIMCNSLGSCLGNHDRKITNIKMTTHPYRQIPDR